MAKKYKLHGEEGYIQDTETMGIIPNSMDNMDYVKYKEWEALGNTPDAWKTKEELDAEKASKKTNLEGEMARTQAEITACDSVSGIDMSKKKTRLQTLLAKHKTDHGSLSAVSP